MEVDIGPSTSMIVLDLDSGEMELFLFTWRVDRLTSMLLAKIESIDG